MRLTLMLSSLIIRIRNYIKPDTLSDIDQR
jgi:hypothetical protein